ncbi:MAG: hypothetical protein HQL67_11515 [Magnetococcales bacterium]|nr:hypothetical protein [Magnetococcales bacterium]
MSDPTLDQNSNTPYTPLLEAVRKLLRPLVRLLIARDIPYPALLPYLKQVYVECATNDFTVDRNRQTDSRIHFLTGVHRKDVKRIRSEIGRPPPPPEGLSVGSNMLAIWLGDPGYQTQQGKPIPLPRFSTAGELHSFEELVRTVSVDVRPRTVLDEWKRQGLIHEDEAGRLHLDQNAFVPSQDEEKMAYYFGRNLRDHMGAAVHNLLGQSPPLLERSVHYDQLSAASCQTLQKIADKAAMEALITVNKAALELAKRDKGAADAVHRINLGVYFMRERQEADPEIPGESEIASHPFNCRI